MIPLWLDLDESASAIGILGGSLDPWQDAVQMAWARSNRAEPYDPLLDGPVLRDGVVWVGYRNLDLVELALNGLIRAAMDIGLAAMATRLRPFQRALAGIRAMDPDGDATIGSVAG